MQDVIRIPLSERVVDYLQSLEFELGGLKVLHTHALHAGVPAKKVEEIRQKYLEKYQEFQLAKQEMWASYDAGYPNCRWWVNYYEGVLNIAQRPS